MRRRHACLALCIGPVAAQPMGLRICANQSLGEADDGSTAHRLARLALQQLPELSARFTALPWQRCLSEAAAGRFDAVLSASYTVERAKGLRYPLDAAGLPDAELRMFRLGYVLFRRKDGPVRWDGEGFSGSSPEFGAAIGAERGYSIAQHARERGAVVEDRYPSFGSLVESLRLRRIAAILISQESAVQLLADPQWAREHEISGPPLLQKDYFLPFSQGFADTHPHLVQTIWQALAKARQSAEFQRHFSMGLSGGRRRDLRP